MNHQDLTLEELEQTGWTLTWAPVGTEVDAPSHHLTFTLNRGGQAIYTIETSGETQDEALTPAIKRANAWLDKERQIEEERAALDL
ncbi:MAG: hypothetical protein M3457_03765 [Chloroflexota bacterium]|nr:hypothetical protein [Chloroflexota bacterium]